MNPQAPAQNRNAATVAPATASTQLDNQLIHIVPAAAQYVNPSNFLGRALPLAELGLEVFPIDARGKEPVKLGFLRPDGKPARLKTSTNATKDAQIISIKWGAEEYADCNVGVRFLTTNYGVDIDSLSKCEQILGCPLDLAGARINTSTPDKMHLYFDGALPDWFWTRGAKYKRDTGEVCELFSIRVDGRYLVGPGSIHPKGAVYQWADGVPHTLPATNENLLRQLQEIAGKLGAQDSKPAPMEKTLAPEKFDELCNILRDNFERMEMPAYDERTARHGGINFVFDECVIEPHGDGDNTAQIGVRPDGVLTFSCFHGSHDLKWSGARPLIEARYGSKFDWQGFFDGPKLTIGSATEPTPAAFQPKGTPVEGGDFDFVLNPLAGSDDGWFPRGDVSLLAAASGGGKTTIALELLDKQFRGETIYGHATNKLPYLVLLQDRGQRALRRTLKRLRIDPAQLPYRLIGYGDKVKAIEEAIVASSPKPAVVFIEGIDLLEGDSGKGHNVEAFLTRLQKLAEHYHIAIIGSTGCPKMKPKDKYTSLRDTVIGSSVWSRKVETIVTLQKEHGKETDDITIMTVLPRNAKVEEFRLEFKDGRLVEAPEVVEPTPYSPNDFVTRQGEEPFSRLKLQAAMNWSKTTACDWLALEVEKGTLVKDGPPKAVVYRQKIGWTVEDCEKIARS